ncbi:hypothetical protein [Polyangium sp. y55x31]|uniref:hypothetical protein n=1 Tax=Polyangium sp. y55x31 TaxID=3042688 RepID=UPI0024831DF4|nr:hypothetical protein [Polyangium sp. y55x31]MDI1482022.1 hypothetical protein [Polyangium sp. y55x31]
MEGATFCDRKGNGFRLGRRGLGSPVSLALVAAIASSLVTTGARADEPRSATEPRVMQEPGEVVNVIDAFDEGDPFDIAISLGFQYSTKSAKVLRETNIFGPGLTSGGFTSNLMNVAQFSEQTSRLIPRVDIGLYKDLALYLRAPIILNNSRELTGLDGSDRVQSVVLAGAPGEQLFSLPFNSPDRSGLEYLAVGLDTSAFMNQARDRTKPTLLFGVEGRFSLGTPMHACNPDAPSGQVQCAHPSDINRNGQADGGLEGFDVSEREAGVTRGTIGLEVHTLVSKRIKYLEPYGGFSALFEFQQEDSDYGLTDLEGSLVNRPPIRGTMTLGLMIIPWENREKFGRLTFDLRVQGTYTSEGRDYSEIFDALGASTASSLRQPQWAKYRRNPNYDENAPAGMREPISIIDEGSQKTYVTGLTDVQQYASIRGQASVTWQASEYVKFNLGFGFTHDQKHGITGDQPCNPTFKDDIGQSGPCKSGNELNVGEFVSATGIPNPNYRPTINAVGRRFWVSDSNTFDVFASGVVMF